MSRGVNNTFATTTHTGQREDVVGHIAAPWIGVGEGHCTLCGGSEGGSSLPREKQRTTGLKASAQNHKACQPN